MNLYDLKNYLVSSKDTIITCLTKINQNKKTFLFVVDDKSKKILGTISMGDIVREIIKHNQLDHTIENTYTRDFIYINENCNLENIIKKFKDKKIRFLPILDNNKKIKNIITKKQLHTLMLEDFDFNAKFDFFSLDEEKHIHELYDRPWGFYKTVLLNNYSRLKLISLKPNEEISLQEHKKREEHWVIIKGQGKCIIGESEKYISNGNYIYIPKGCKHKVINTSNKENLIFSEVQLGSSFEERDIIRYEDKYGRV